MSWEAVPYAICYVVTKNGEVAGFTTETTFDGYTAADLWQVQAVNEQGGLSQKATANTSTGISRLTSDSLHQATVFYTIDGRSHTTMQRGLNIVRMSDGTVCKVIRK